MSSDMTRFHKPLFLYSHKDSSNHPVDPLLLVLPRFADLAPTSAIARSIFKIDCGIFRIDSFRFLQFKSGMKIDLKSIIESQSSPIIDSDFFDRFRALFIIHQNMVKTSGWMSLQGNQTMDGQLSPLHEILQLFVSNTKKTRVLLKAHS